MRRTIFITLVFSIVWAVSLNAQTNTNVLRQISLAECIALAVEKNLDIRIARYGPEIAQFNLDAAYGVYDPAARASYVRGYSSSPAGRIDPDTNLQFPTTVRKTDTFLVGMGGLVPTGLRYDLGANLTHQEQADFQYAANERLTLRQPVLKNFLMDAERLQIALSKKDLKISHAALLLQLMSIVTSTKQAYYDLIFARENVKVQEKALELADRFVFENRQKVKVGAMAPLGGKQAEAEAAVTRSDLLSARRLLDVQENILKRLLSDDFPQWSGVTIVPAETLTAVFEPVNLADSWYKGLTLRPELTQLKLALENVDVRLKYNRNQLLPILDLVGSYGHNSVDITYRDSLGNLRERNDPFYTFGAEFSIPFSNRGPRNRYRATKAEKEQSLLRLKQLEQDVMIEIDDAVKLVQTSYERVDATRQARLYADSALDAEQRLLDGGKSTIFVVLQLQRDMTARRSEEIRALADYNIALANLARREGTTLERNAIRVEVK